MIFLTEEELEIPCKEPMFHLITEVGVSESVLLAPLDVAVLKR